jgi:AraC-like DNA-binding protein
MPESASVLSPGQPKKMSKPFEHLVAEGLECKLSASYKINKDLFDECLEGLPAYSNCLLSAVDAKGQAVAYYFVPQGEIFSKSQLTALFTGPYVLDLFFFDAAIEMVPLFGMPGLKILQLHAIEQFSALRSLLEYESTHALFLRENVINSTLEKTSFFIIREYKAGQEEVAQYFNNYFDEPRLFKVLTYIHQNMSEELTLEVLGELIELSPDYISQFFKRCVGMSIQAYLIDQRVKQGLYKLIASHDQISDIAFRTGFIDQAYFNRRFKIFYRMNPLRLRKQYQLLFISRAGTLLTLEK